MRVLFLSLVEAHWGGSEVLWYQTAIAARAAGWATAAFFPYYKNLPQTRQLERLGADLFFGTAGPRRWWLRLLAPSPDRRERFANALTGFAPDLVVVNQGGSLDGLEEMEQCRRRARPYVILNQQVEPLFHCDLEWERLRKCHGNALATWCVSRENLERLRRYLDLPLPTATVIPNAYACPYDIPPSWPEDDGVWKLATVARLENRQKGLDLLLDVLAAPVWRDRPVRFSLYGEGPCFRQLSARRASLGLSNVEIKGASAPVSNIWAQHHALLLPSRFEGQSLAMIEAMLHARPVIATPTDGTGGVIINGKTGFLARTMDTAAYAELLEQAWAARDLWRGFGLAAHRHIRAIVSPFPGQAMLGRLAALPLPVRPSAG